MVTFCISLIALVLGYLLYGRFVDSVFGPDDRETPAVAMADGVDHIVLGEYRLYRWRRVSGDCRRLVLCMDD